MDLTVVPKMLGKHLSIALAFLLQQKSAFDIISVGD